MMNEVEQMRSDLEQLQQQNDYLSALVSGQPLYGLEEKIADLMQRNKALREELDQLKAETKRLDAAVGEEISNRDRVEAHADRLADGIAKALGVDIGEHSSANCPWNNAFFAIDEFDLAGHDAEVIELAAKPIATEFFRWWYNQPGSNTDQGFDEWWKLRQQAREVQSAHSEADS